MTLLVLGVVYVLVGVICACRITGLLAWRMWAIDNSLSPNSPDGLQWFGAAFFGILGGLFWPLAIIPLTFRRLFFRPPAEIRQWLELQEIERQMKELDR